MAHATFKKTTPALTKSTPARAIAASAAAVLSLVSCSGQQFSLPAETKEFGQKVTYNTDVDVLWVIDTSESMKKHQELLAAQVGLFVDAFDQTGLDYQMAVTTMDMSASGEKGRFVAQAGTPSILKKGTANLVSTLSQRLVLGEAGSPVERGLEAVKAALTASASTTGPNAGFLRENSLLVVVFLTNEEDQSASADYGGFLDRIRPALPSGDRSWIAHYMGVMPDDPNCKTAEWGYSSIGHKYIDLATQSNGVAETICDADLRRALTNVKARVLEVMTEYQLDRKPLVSSIRVFVDGQPLASDPANGWTYNESRNTISFHGTAIPKAGSSIRVAFDPAELK